MKTLRRYRNKCTMEMMMEEMEVQGHKIQGINIVRKHQQATFLFDTATTGGDRIDKWYLVDWREIHKGSLGRNR